MTDPLRVTLLGCDGSAWELTDPASPVRLCGGLGGLHLPVVKHRWATTARHAGRRWKGSVTDARSFTMNLLVGESTTPGTYGSDWRSLDALFWQALSTDELATLVIGGERSLSFRLDEDNSADFIDPGTAGLAPYAVDCIADGPFWLGNPVSATFEFQTQDTTSYYGGTGFGPPFFITEASLFEAASVSNPGDLPAPAVWTVRGPASAFRVGVDGHVTQPPFALQDGDVVIIDTEAETITDPTGNNLWPLMGYTPVDFAPIPPGDEVPIAIGMDNPGPGASVSVSLTPRFRRAWGPTVGGPLVIGGGGGGVGGLGDEPLGDGPLGD